MIHLRSSDSNSSENLFNVGPLELSFYHRLSDKSILNLYRNELLIWLPKSSLSLEKIGEMEIESRSILEDRNELGTIEEILIEREKFTDISTEENSVVGRRVEGRHGLCWFNAIQAATADVSTVLLRDLRSRALCMRGGRLIYLPRISIGRL